MLPEMFCCESEQTMIEKADVARKILGHHTYFDWIKNKWRHYIDGTLYNFDGSIYGNAKV